MKLQFLPSQRRYNSLLLGSSMISPPPACTVFLGYSLPHSVLSWEECSLSVLAHAWLFAGGPHGYGSWKSCIWTHSLSNAVTKWRMRLMHSIHEFWSEGGCSGKEATSGYVLSMRDSISVQHSCGKRNALSTSVSSNAIKVANEIISTAGCVFSTVFPIERRTPTRLTSPDAFLNGFHSVYTRS